MHVGESFESEKRAAENDVCRKIAQEISRFGISDRQRLFLIHLLSLELEDVALMQAVATAMRVVDDDLGQRAFLTELQKPSDG